jgi:CubicO group peptidase (beta-lactamase class C family)
MTLDDPVEHWSRRLAKHAGAAEVPGAVLGIWADGEQIVVPHGVLSTGTAASTTADSVFQVGSITKLWTATMIMQLVDEGRATLDSTVAELLPGVRLGADDVADRVTMRHLLTHTSGIDGDVFVDTGRGDDCLERYVELLASGAQTHPVGAGYSYCNAGFVLLGRLIEVLDGVVWDEALRRRIVEPLGLSATVTLPEDAILHRAAVGHQAHPHADAPVTTWGLMRSIGPAGLITSAAGDLLAFARLHLDGGVGSDGQRLLSAESAASMLDEQVRLPPGGATYDAVGLTWRVYDWDGRRLVGHDGTTLGQYAYLRVDPDARLAVCLLTNSPNGPSLYQSMVSDVLDDFVGVRVPNPPAPVDVVPHRPQRHVGRYERAGARFDISRHPSGLLLTSTETSEFAELSSDSAVNEYVLLPLDESGDRYAFRDHAGQPWAPVTFDRFADGAPYVFVGARTTPKVDQRQMKHRG